MSDLISRQAAIDAIANCTNCGDEKTLRAYVAKHNLDNEWSGGVLEAINAVEDLPSAQPEQRWIPCSERLPEIKQHVLLSCYGRVIYGRMMSEDGNGGYPVFEICDSVGEKRPIVLETTVHSEFTTSRIIAWMPLPEPYQEEGEKDGKDT